MRLSTRIAFGAAVIIALTILVLGVTMVRATRTTLVAEIDDRLRDSLHRAEVLPGPWDDDDHNERGGRRDDGRVQSGCAGPLCAGGSCAVADGAGVGGVPERRRAGNPGDFQLAAPAIGQQRALRYT